MSPIQDTEIGQDELGDKGQGEPDQSGSVSDQKAQDPDDQLQDQEATPEALAEPAFVDDFTTTKKSVSDDSAPDNSVLHHEGGTEDLKKAAKSAKEDDEQKSSSESITQSSVAEAEKNSDSAAPSAQKVASDTGQEMTFTAHLQELRIRLTRSLVGIFVGFLACYGFSEHLFRKLMAPLISLLEPKDGTLIYTGLPEAFFTHVKVAAVAGLFLASPYVFYQLWMFIAPGLYESERKWIVPIALSSAVLFVLGALFGYYIVFPFGFQFFLGYATDFVTPMPSVREYFSFSVAMLFAFGLIFELPLFIFFLARLGIVTHKSLRKFQKYSILVNFIVGAILTPPDVVSQVLMVVPLCILYEVGIWIAFIFGRKPKNTEAEGEGAQA